MKKTIQKILGTLPLLIAILCSGIFINKTETFAAANTGSSTTTHTTTNSSGVKPVEISNYHKTDNPSINLNEFGDFTPVTSVGEFATKILEFLMKVLGGIAMLGVVAGGIMIMGGGFSEDTMENGKTLLLYSVIGVGVAMLAMVIVTLAQSFLYSFGK